MDGADLKGAARIDREPFEHFLFHEAALLDQRRFRDWMALFARTGPTGCRPCPTRRARSTRLLSSTTIATS